MFGFLFLSVVAGAVANPHEGACPEVKPVENFNLTAYQGVWFEISKTPNPSEGQGQCGQAEYTLDGDVVKVKNTHVIDGVQTFVEGTAKFAADADNSAKLVVSLNVGDTESEAPLLVLATDYNGYAIAYNCKYDEQTKAHKDHVWILSRSKTLEGEAKTAVDTFLKEHATVVGADKLAQTDFSEDACKFNSTSVATGPATAKP